MNVTTRRETLFGAAALGGVLAAPALLHAAAARPDGVQAWILATAEGEVVDGADIDRLSIPASITKSVTAFAALSLLPHNARFQTRLVADGAVSKGVLSGDLHLVGSGDPSLDTADLFALVRSLRKAGIRSVSGGFVYHDAALPRVPMLNGAQPWQAGYNPALGGLNLNFNRALMKWRGKGKSFTLEGLAHADRKTVRAGNMRFIASETAGDFDHRIGADGEIWTVPRASLRRPGQRWMPVRDPGRYAAATFRLLAKEAGIRVSPPRRAEAAPGGGETIAFHRSDVSYALLTKMMKYSTNLTAEVMGAKVAQRLGPEPQSIEDAAMSVSGWLSGQADVFAGGGGAGLHLVNHSGLSSASRITPRQMAAVLNAGMARYGGAFSALHSEGEVSRDGKVLKRPHSLRSKTGTMHFVRCLAGMLEIAGKPHVFAIMSADEERRAAVDAAFEPFSETRPPGARRWLNRAQAFERDLLARWVERV